MRLNHQRLLLTGATGGIGRELAARLATHKLKMVISSRNDPPLNALATQLRDKGAADVYPLAADITSTEQCRELITRTTQQLGGLDILINLAGAQTFKPFVSVSDADIQRQLALNLKAPMILAREASRMMMTQKSGRIVNIGSTFGSIGFANFSVYSASKFGLRGFTESLRRELKGSGIQVNYIAPRATQTAMNDEAVYQLATQTGMSMDTPAAVADEIIKAILTNRKNHFIGFPERIFARINAVFPGLVDVAVQRQNLIAKSIFNPSIKES